MEAWRKAHTFSDPAPRQPRRPLDTLFIGPRPFRHTSPEQLSSPWSGAARARCSINDEGNNQCQRLCHTTCIRHTRSFRLRQQRHGRTIDPSLTRFGSQHNIFTLPTTASRTAPRQPCATALLISPSHDDTLLTQTMHAAHILVVALVAVLELRRWRKAGGNRTSPRRFRPFRPPCSTCAPHASSPSAINRSDRGYRRGGALWPVRRTACTLHFLERRTTADLAGEIHPPV